MPTGTALRDVREQLFGAAERVLRRDGPGALTSRAVTDEAGCAKGVLHRHFTDVDGFLAELVLDRIARLEGQARALDEAVGRGSVVANLAGALSELFGPVAVATVALVTFHDGLRDRLRRARPAGGVPLLTEAATMLAGHLAAERDRGRLTPDADPDALARTLIGTGHLLFADRDRPAPGTDDVRGAVDEIVRAYVRP